jgi:hypothetical protein
MISSAATAVILDLVSIDFMTNVWVDWSVFLVAHWGCLVEGSFRRSRSILPIFLWLIGDD